MSIDMATPSPSAGLVGSLRSLASSLWALCTAWVAKTYWNVRAIPHLGLAAFLVALVGLEVAALVWLVGPLLMVATAVVVAAGTAVISHQVAVYRGDV